MFEPKKNLLLISTSKQDINFLKDISNIHHSSDFAFYKENISSFDNPIGISQILAKRETSLFIHKNKNTLTIGRSYNNELIDTIEYKLTNYESTKALIEKKQPTFEIGSLYFLCLVNIKGRLENLLIDLFSCKSQKQNIDGVKYRLVVEKIDNRLDFAFEDLRGNLRGPKFSLELVRKFYCEDDVFKVACERVKEKKVKNVAVNDMKDVMGTIHMEKQDLSEIKLKKPRKIRQK